MIFDLKRAVCSRPGGICNCLQKHGLPGIFPQQFEAIYALNNQDVGHQL